MRPRLLPLLLLVFALGCTLWQEKSPPTWKSATGPEAYTQLLWQEIKAKNFAEVERRLAATYVAIGPAGRLDRAQAVEHFKQFEIDDFAIGEVDVRPNGPDMVVTYSITLRGRLAGQPLASTPYRMMTVWQEVKGGWIVIAHAVVPATS